MIHLLDNVNLNNTDTSSSLIIDSVTYNDCELFRIKRNNNDTLLLQKNVGIIFFPKPSTFNSMCWNMGVEQKPASSEELSILRRLNAVEKGTRKANLLPLESITKVLEHSKRHEILDTLKLLIVAPANSSHVGTSYSTMSDKISTSKTTKTMANNILVTSTTISDTGLSPQTLSNISPSAVTSPTSPISPISPISPPTKLIDLASTSEASLTPITPPSTIKPIRSNISPIQFDIVNSNEIMWPSSITNQNQPMISLINSDIIQTACDKSMVMNNNNKTTIKRKKYTLSENEFSSLLQQQLFELQSFWMGPNNLLRQAPAVNIVTHSKRRERTLCYLGWLKSERMVNNPNLNHFDVADCDDNRQFFEDYITYLKEIRKLSDGTIVGKLVIYTFTIKPLTYPSLYKKDHITAGVYCLKWIYCRESNTDFENIKSIQQLKLLRNSYQRGYEKESKKDWVELREEGRFLHFEEVQQVLKQLQVEFMGNEKDITMIEKNTPKKDMYKKAKQLQKFLILLMYVSLPPSR